MKCPKSRWHSVVGLLVCVSITELAVAIDIHVDDSRPSNGTGQDWSDAFKYLKDAIDVAQSGDTIKVAQGFYFPDRGEGLAPPDRWASFQLNPGVRIQGGYAGVGAPNPDENNPALFVTMLFGDLLENDDPSDPNSIVDNSNLIVAALESASTAPRSLSGVVIKAGYGQTLGTGMGINGASPRIDSCTFIGNRGVGATGNGVGLGCTGNSQPVIRKSRFVRNTSEVSSGAGIYVANAGVGDSSKVTVVNCLFDGNRAGSLGGGIAFAENGAAEQSLVMNSVFSGNVAAVAGGGMCVRHNDNVRVSNCTFMGNEGGLGPLPPGSEDFRGGGGFALVNLIASPPVRSVSLQNSIFWGNKAPPDRGQEIAMLGVSGSSATLSVDYCVVRDMDDTGIFKAIGALQSANNIGNDLFADDPRVLREPNRGPDDEWGTLDDDYGDLRLAYNSACIMRGDDSLIPADLADLNNDGNLNESTPYDLAMNTRARCVVEMGAYELTPTACTGDADYDGDVDIDDFTIIILNWEGPGPVGDVAPSPCGNHFVDIDDYSEVVLTWGCGTSGGLAAMPQSITECLEFCDFEPDCFQKCIAALQEAGVIP